MTKSTKTTKKQPTPTDTPAAPPATVPVGSPMGKPKPRKIARVATRRVPVHYTPRIPSARCPTC